jgi:hypothetical protein
MAARTESSIGLVPPPGYRLVREEVPMPPSRELRLLEIQSILEKNIQRLVVEVGKPIVYFRVVKADEAGLDEIVEEDLYMQARNAEMEEFPPEEAPEELPFITIQNAFKELRSKGLKPLAFLIGNAVDTSRWLFGRPMDIAEIFGVKTVKHGEVPEGGLLLLASNPGEDEVVFSLRIQIGEAK